MKKIVSKIILIFFILTFLPQIVLGTTNMDNSFVININSGIIKGIANMEETEDGYKLVPVYEEGAVYTYSSSDKDIAEIDSEGKIEIKNNGEVIICVIRQMPNKPNKETEEFQLKINFENKLATGIVGTNIDQIIGTLKIIFTSVTIIFIVLYALYIINIYKSRKEKRMQDSGYSKKHKGKLKPA